MSLYQRLKAEQENELYHHGIEGQKWGVRKVPWYPIAEYLKSRRDVKRKAKSNEDAYKKAVEEDNIRRSKIPSKYDDPFYDNPKDAPKRFSGKNKAKDEERYLRFITGEDIYDRNEYGVVYYDTKIRNNKLLVNEQDEEKSINEYAKVQRYIWNNVFDWYRSDNKNGNPAYDKYMLDTEKLYKQNVDFNEYIKRSNKIESDMIKAVLRDIGYTPNETNVRYLKSMVIWD